MPVFTTNVTSFCVATAIDDDSHDDKDLEYCYLAVFKI